MSASIADFSLSCAATALYVYPVKSCAGMPVQALELDARGGAAGDREWAVVDADGAVTWQGAFARLALVHPHVTGGRLRLAAGMLDEVEAPPDAELTPCRIKIWNDVGARHDTFDAADAGDAVAAWLERAAGAPLRLVKLGAAALARDGTNALHLVFAPSMAAVDAQRAAVDRLPADPRRYRPNTVLSAPSAGDGVDFIEESLAALDWQHDATSTRLQITAPCVRCVVPNVDPVSANVDDSVFDTLARMSRERRPDGPVVFGVYARGPEGARLHVGDSAHMALAF